MKKKLFTIFLVISICSLAFSQNESTRKASYFCALEGYSGIAPIHFDNCYQLWNVGACVVQGVQFNPHLMLGIGLGFDYFPCRESYENLYNGYLFSSYLDLKYIILKRWNWSPMISASLGYGGLLSQSVGNPNDKPTLWTNGMVLKVFCGAQRRFENNSALYFGLEFETHIICLDMKVGYKF